eukprot:scaffold75867_cov34-Phaeocystis_antarctica.AAC.3
MSDGNRAQPKQARLGISPACEGAPSSLAAGGAVAGGAAAASLSAFSAASASRTSLVAAPSSGCFSRSLASSGLKPRSGSVTRSPRTASRRVSGVQASHMRGAPGARAAAGGQQPAVRVSALRPVARGLAKFERGGKTGQYTRSRANIDALMTGHRND